MIRIYGGGSNYLYYADYGRFGYAGSGTGNGGVGGNNLSDDNHKSLYTVPINNVMFNIAGNAGQRIGSSSTTEPISSQSANTYTEYKGSGIIATKLQENGANGTNDTGGGGGASPSAYGGDGENAGTISGYHHGTKGSGAGGAGGGIPGNNGFIGGAGFIAIYY
jgi:hypothetical protein